MPRTSPSTGQRGYAALALAILLAAAGLSAALGALDPGAAKRRRASDAMAALHVAKEALLGFAVTYRDTHENESFGFLPCPDTSGGGTERTPCGSGGAVAVGLLPYKTLALPELRDAEGNCLWYAVSGTFKSSPKSYPINWDTRGQITVRDALGRTLAAPADDNGGAAAVIVAPGAALSAQRRDKSAACSADAGQVSRYLENDASVFTHGIVRDTGGEPSANDILVWISPKEIFDAVVRRKDFPAYLQDGIVAMRPMLGAQRNAAGHALPSANPFGRSSAHYAFYESWRDQFRYWKGTGTAWYAGEDDKLHASLLLFGGRAADGKPRVAGAPLQDYFEAALTLAETGTGTPRCRTDTPSYDNTSAAGGAADMVLCLGAEKTP